MCTFLYIYMIYADIFHDDLNVATTRPATQLRRWQREEINGLTPVWHVGLESWHESSESEMIIGIYIPYFVGTS